MRLRFRSPIVISCSSGRGQAIALFSVRIARAALFSYFIFCAYTRPIGGLPDWFAGLVITVVRVLDLPVAVVARGLPEAVRPFSIWFDSGRRYGLEPSWLLYLAVTVPVYLGIFYGVDALRRAIGRSTAATA